MNPVATSSPFAPETLVSMVLLASRVGGVVLIAPLFSAKLIPVAVRTALVILFTLVLHPAARSVAGARGVTPAAVATT